MPQAVQPSFPMFIVVREIDKEYTLKTLPAKSPVSSVSVSVQGVERKFVAWFVDARDAAHFISTSKIKGYAMPIEAASDAVAFLEQHSFAGICLNPHGPRDPHPVLYDRQQAIANFRAMAGQVADES